MTKRFLVVFAVCFMLLPMLDAQANVIEPPRNRFLFQHGSETVRLGRRFYANDEISFVPVKNAPSDNAGIAVLEHNEAYLIRYTLNYQGELWGFLDQIHTARRRLLYGWVRMDQLLLRYDRISFTEEHQHEFYPFTGSYEALKTAEGMVLWEWPGSGIIRHIFDATRIERILNENLTASHAFLDEYGREWVFFDRSLFIVGHNVWVYLSDPSNRDIPAFNPPRPVVWQPAGADISTAADISISTDIPTSEPPISELIIILVAGLSVSTATLIRVFWKPNKRA